MPPSRPSANHPTRRRVLALAAAASVLPVDRLAFAAGPKERPLVIILLRGGPDGQALLPSHGDPAYEPMRGGLALPPPGEDGGILDLDGRVGLHPALSPLLPFWTAGEMAVAPAIASPHRGRSHFEAQNVLESGLDAYDATADSGWLNRAISAAGGASPDSGPAAVALGRALPLALRGPAPTSPWSPDLLPRRGAGFFQRVAALYADDALFAGTLRDGLAARAAMAAALGEEDRASQEMGNRAQDLPVVAEIAGRVLAASDGPGVALIELGGWDTHQNQGTVEGPLARRIAGLADGMAALADALGDAWANSAVVAIGEFGRTVRPNGTRGTDHGTAGAALVLGGGLSGASVLGAEPQLSENALFEGRDLAPTADSRALLKGLLARHWGLSRSVLDKRVFPDSSGTPPLDL